MNTGAGLICCCFILKIDRHALVLSRPYIATNMVSADSGLAEDSFMRFPLCIPQYYIKCFFVILLFLPTELCHFPNIRVDFC
jgi:hypothetical protein